jgi:uncharacterized protein YndB with AHSA1/START domain/predicted enzyme related to lactoylglutathione lyase
MINGLRGATIWSEDLNNLLPFYRDVLGLPVGLSIPGFVVLGEMGKPVLALGTHSEVKGRNADPARHMVGLGTDDVDTEWKRLRQAGVEFVENPTDYGSLRIATLKDPEGNLLQLLQPLPPRAAGEEEIVITRVVDAPRARVFEAWTEPERLVHWWGPNGFTTPVARIDARPGGLFHACMRSPEGQDFWSCGIYREVVAPARIVCTDSFADAEGNVVEPTQYGMSATWPREALITLTFEEHAGKTTVALRHAVPGAAASEIDMCRQGWNESLDRLAAYAAKDSGQC